MTAAAVCANADPFSASWSRLAQEPYPLALLDQLAPGGRIAIPVGDEVTQTLLVGERTNNGAVHWEQNVPCMFVPLIEPS